MQNQYSRLLLSLLFVLAAFPAESAEWKARVDEEATAPPAAPVVTMASKEIVYSFKGLPASLHKKVTGLFADFPDIDRDQTVFGGFSNGGNTAAALLTAPESAGEFLAMFRYLVLAEGGWGAVPGASMKDHGVLVLQGGLRKTGRLDDEIAKLKAAGAEVAEYAMEGVEHEYSRAGKEHTRK